MVVSSLASLPLEFETVTSQIFSSSKISSLHDTFIRVLQIETFQVLPHTSPLISHKNNTRQGDKGGDRRGPNGGRDY